MVGVTSRRTAGIGVILMLVGALTVVLGLPALAQANPATECESALWNGDYWKIQVNNGSLGTIETNLASDAIDFALNKTVDPWVATWENNNSEDVFRIVRKTGHTDPPNIEGRWSTGDGGTFTLPEDISHVTFCFTDTEEPPTTEDTTPTTEDTTPTTEDTTPTTEETTPTTEDTTPTTEETTSTTEDDSEVGGIVVTNPSNPQVTPTTAAAGTTASTLPFTGMSTGSVAVIGAALAALGTLLLVASRRSEDKVAARSWS